MRRSQKISAVPDTLRLLQSKLWYNDKYKAFFSTHHTNNPQEYYWFILDIDSGYRKHGRYRLTTEGVIIEFFKGQYKLKELIGMVKYEICMIQLTDTSNELNYHNWIGIELPAEKGLPYTIELPQYG